MCTILKVFTEFVTIPLLFYVLFFFGREVCGILAPQPGMEPVLSALEGNVLTSGLPGKSLSGLFQVLHLSPELLLALFNPTRSLLLVVKMQTT